MVSKDLIKDSLLKLLLCSENLAIKVSCPSFRRERLLASDVSSELNFKKTLFSETRHSDKWQIVYGNSKIEFIPRDGGNSAEYIIELS